MVSRISWDDYFLGIAHLTAQRSTCLRRQVGAVLVKNHYIVATGYNGAPTGLQHCLDIGCLREKLLIPSGENAELCRSVHAEQNAIIQAAYHGISTCDTTLYCTTFPCSICAKMIVNAGIKKIIYSHQYANDLFATELLTAAGIIIKKVNKE